MEVTPEELQTTDSITIRALKDISFGSIAGIASKVFEHPFDLTKVRLQASGDSRMLASIQKTYRAAGVRGLFDGITGTWFRQMTYSICRFWAYDESKKLIGAGECHQTSLSRQGRGGADVHLDR